MRRVIRVLLIMVWAVSARAAVIQSTFDSDLDGWTGPGGIASFSATGGNPGGFLRMTDTESDTLMTLYAPGKFLGDLTAFEHGMILFDAIAIDAAPNTGVFGQITFRSGSGLFIDDIVPSGRPFVGEWTTFGQPIDRFPSGLGPLLSNITAIEIVVDYAEFGIDGESVGFDNFRFDTVPEPSLATIVALALILRWHRRDKGRVS